MISKKIFITAILMPFIWTLMCVNFSIFAGDSSRNCKLVTPEEVAKVVGKPIIKTGDSALGCAYIPKKSNLSHFTVFVTDKDADLFDTFSKPRPDVTIKALSGIGDHAALAVRNEKVFDAIVISGKWSVRFNFTFANVKLGTTKYENLIKLLKAAADRL